mmetsp:Transcript_16922/g.39087  ORF Transcript_16922/g.39087 Transcript_16922/m.39087 type:complete len:1041 (-) Transcript_16922:4192-7314(-)
MAMTTRKRKQRDPSSIGSNAKDPTATWKPNVRLNKGYAFSRRTKMIRLTTTDSDPSEGSEEQGLKRFRKGRSEFQKVPQRDLASGTDSGVKKPASQNPKKQPGGLNPNEKKKGTGVENRRIIGSGNIGEQHSPRLSFSCSDVKNRAKSIASISSSQNSIGTKANTKPKAITNFHSGLSSPSKSNKKTLSVDVDCHRPLQRTNTNCNIACPRTFHGCLPNACSEQNCISKKQIHDQQDVKFDDDAKKIVPSIPNSSTKNNGTNKTNPTRNNSELDASSFDLSKKISNSDSNRMSSAENHFEIIDESRFPNEISGSNKKSEAKMLKETSEAKDVSPKVHHKKHEQDFRRQPTPFLRKQPSVVVEVDDKLHVGSKTLLQQRHEVKNVEVLHLDPPPLLRQSNALALSGNEPSIFEEKQSCGERVSREEQVKETNLPETSLFRNQTESSTDIMGLSPLEEFRRRAESIDEGFYDGGSPSSTDATTGLVNPLVVMMKIPRQQHLQTPKSIFVPRSSDGRFAASISTHDKGDSFIEEYYSRDVRNIVKPKPKQLLDEFNSAAPVNVDAEIRKHNIEHPTAKKSNPIKKAFLLKNIRGNETKATPSIDFDENVVLDTSIPKFILGTTREDRKNIGKKKKEYNVHNHPLRLNTTILDGLITAALESRQNLPKQKESKRKSGELIRKVNRKGRANKNSNLIRCQHKHSTMNYDKTISTEPLNDDIKCDTRKSMKPGKVRGNLIPVSFEPPPVANRRYQPGVHSNTPSPIAGIGHTSSHTQKSKFPKKIRDASRRVSLESPSLVNRRFEPRVLSSAHIASGEKKKIADNKYMRSHLAETYQRYRIRLDDDDSSDWSADWDNLSIESIPRNGHNLSECIDANRDGVTHFVEDLARSEDENGVPTRVLNGEEAARRAKNFKNQHCEQSAPVDYFTRHETDCNPTETFPLLVVEKKLQETSANSRSRSRAIVRGVKKVSIVTHRSICRIAFLFYFYAVIWLLKEEDSLSNFQHGIGSFKGMREYGMRRPSIRFTENPSSSLVKASKIYETTVM